jgi:signal transduction histidine kinase/ActR/RegA family two-component response regulator
MIDLEFLRRTDKDNRLDGAAAYQLTLVGLVLPKRLHYIFNALAAVVGVLLGHPWLAAVGFVASSAADTFYQMLVQRWLAASADADGRSLWLLALACACRVSVYLMIPVAMVLRGGPAELIYFGIVAYSLIAVASSAGALSRLVFWGITGPILFASLICAVVLLEPMGITAVLLAGTCAGFLLALISLGSTRAVAALHAAFNMNLAMIPKLQGARDKAVDESRAAEAAREEARRSAIAKSDFLATMSHEIRTPMNGVLGMAELLRRDETDPVQIERIGMLIENGQYLMSILDDVLDVSKIDAGRLEIAPAPEDLRLFLNRLVSFWSGRADERGVAISLQIAPGTPHFVMMDALRMRQVLCNLVGNALKFTETGSVTILAQAREKEPGVAWVRLAVRDTGPGIGPDHLPTLFDRFSQVDQPEARPVGGTGLGLAIAKQLTELMDGNIWVESTLGEGATFHIEIPLTLAARPARIAAVTQPAPEPAPAQRGLEILAVDDTVLNTLLLEQLLGAFGHRVARADSGPEALEMLGEKVFDVVLLDVHMPGMSGLQVLDRLRREDGLNQATPVIALTADVTSADRASYLEMGFNEHGSKPLQIEALKTAIARAVAGPVQPAEARAA